MQLKVLAFAQAHDQLGFRECEVECSASDSPRMIVSRLAPEAQLGAMRVAVDCEYHDWDAAIGTARELAVIPPVSGG